MSEEKNKNTFDKDVYHRYLNGKGNIQDRGRIAKWFTSLKNTETLKEASWSLWNSLPEEQEIEDYDETGMLHRINHLLRIEDAQLAKEKQARLKWIIYVRRVAAGLFIPLLIFSGLQWFGILGRKESTAYSSIYSPLGARTNFHLPDGSQGWLNGGSSLRFPVSFSGKYREVQLEGEAYFNVVSNPKKPFVVSTDEIKVVALGTSFNVNAYQEDGTSEVLLESGLVALYEAEDQQLKDTLRQLNPGFQFTYFKDLDSYRVETADIGKVISWTEGKIIFREDSMKEVVARLNRWYNVDIRIEDSKLETHTFRATFQDETLDEVLKLLKISTPIEIREEGREMLEDNTFGKRRIILSLK